MSATPVAPDAPGADLDWVMSGLKKKVPGVLHALTATADGLHLASTPGLDPATQKLLSSITSGLASLTASAATTCGAERPVQTLVEIDRGFMIVASIGDTAAVIVLTSRDVDLGLVGYELGLLVQRIGRVLTPGLRGTTAVPAQVGQAQREDL
ncbi:roadblock/LC7 domain-containing protein [Aquipuribacter sp. MA13-6]|uniref:roadblock/LC7 domain-containing protein n=1 Tax=unclassified Aquipuribacter TaxID=2635084 RepID=UPI003EEE020D